MLKHFLALSVVLPLSLLVGASSAVASTTVVSQGSSATVSASHPVLKLGSRGTAVKALQQRLLALHYFDVGKADGVFGPNTYHAVVAFQKVQRIARDGIVGPVTWAHLASPYKPSPRYRLVTSALEVDLTRQVVYYVRSGKVQRIADASTGSGKWYYSGGSLHRAITPTGRFKIYWRVNGWHRSPLGMLYRPNYFHGGYAVHGYSSVPNYPASHGCVRITIPTMDRMWSALWLGMPVAVYRS